MVVESIGDVVVYRGELGMMGRTCKVSLRHGVETAELNPDEVRALIDVLTPYARRRKPWPARSRKP